MSETPSYIADAQKNSSRALSHLDDALNDKHAVAPPPGAPKSEIGKDISQRLEHENSAAGASGGSGPGASAHAANHAAEAAGTDNKGKQQRGEAEKSAAADKGF
ncbi:hypothetical protein HDU87_002022 [Geranomyces variabilis]|uniref:Uncharacterized protein n=1 Tax=Geranomyces variabilis TaxID=109894 RepID=A0AAD5TMU2_9FUNG|nr:hypothetical protein HDU87_002022 [Geranomyces variabilis]